MKKVLIIMIPVLLLLAAGGGGAYYWFMMRPSSAAPKPPPPKIDGTLFALEPEFVVNLAGGHYGKISVALLLAEEPKLDPAAETPKLPQDAAIRAIITDDLSGQPSSRLIEKVARHTLEATILKDLKKSTDTDVTQVLLTDVVVQ